MTNVIEFDASSAAAGDDNTPAFELIRLERLWLALRTNRGLSTTDPLWQSAWTSAGDLLEAWSEAGWVVRTGDSERMSAPGWLRMDELVAALGARMQEERKDTGSRNGDGIRKTDRT